MVLSTPPSSSRANQKLLRLQVMEYLSRANSARDSLELYRLIGALKRRKWGIFGFTLGITALAWYYMQQLPDQYRATAALVIEGSTARVLNLHDVAGGLAPGDFTNHTQAAILTSRELAKKLPAVLARLDANPEKAVDKFLSGLTVIPYDRSFVVRLEYVSRDPVFAAAALNHLTQTYIDEQSRAKDGITTNAARWLAFRAEEMRGRLIESERRLEHARRENGQVLMSGRDLAEEQLSRLSTELGAARLAQGEAKARLAQFDRQRREGGIAPVYSNAASPMVRAESQEAELAARFAEAKARYRENHPEYKAAEQALAAVRARKDTELSTVRLSLVNDAELASISAAQLENDIAALKEKIGTGNDAAIGFRALETEVAANRQLFETLLARYKETDVQEEALHPADARIISQAVVPAAPFEPRRAPVVAAVGIMALLAACGLALIREFHAEGFLTPSQVELDLHLPVLAGLPEFESTSREMSHLNLLDPKNQPLYAEAIRTLRVAQFDRAKAPKVVLVCSSASQEGKTITALSLALTLKNSGKSVLVIDGDLRGSSIGESLRFGKTAGLGDYLSGAVTADQIIYQDTYSGLHVIPAGQAQGHPLDVLGSPAYDRLIAELSGRFDAILIDSPAACDVRDAALLARAADACLYLIRWEQTPRALVAQGLKSLREILPEGAISIAISRIDAKKLGSYSPARGDYVYFTNYAFTHAARPSE